MSSSHKAVVTILTGGAGLAIAKDFEDNKDAEVVICSWNRQRPLEAAGVISGKEDGAELYVTSISKAKQSLEEIMEGPQHSTILVTNSGYHIDSNTWYKIDDELESIKEVGLNGSMRICRNVIDTRTCCYNFFGG
jgi:NAD(P)-dependent dehydrogenase (short-subunit alcohol dehydrogenase family)